MLCHSTCLSNVLRLRQQPRKIGRAARTKASVKKSKKKATIGRSEYIDLPDWGIDRILVKIDTGARTSALHVEDLEEIEDGRVAFHVIVRKNPKEERMLVEADVVKWAKVMSSSGHYSRRCFVRTMARIGPIIKPIEISLDSREKMNYRMLLGRKALSPDFVVDVSKRHAFGAASKDGRKESS